MHRDILSFLEPLQSEALSLLRRLVEIQSGSLNKSGLDRMAREMAEVFSGILPDVRILPFERHGDMVLASNRTVSGGARGILLVGHMDTVFPADTAFTAYREDAEHCYGPGVYDMKGGLVVGVYALMALRHLGLLERMPITFLCNSEEEIGSPASREWIEKLAAKSRAAFVLEGGGANGEVVTGRKGRLGLRLEVRGRAGHAAKSCHDKASAILEMAHKIIALEGLNGDSEITVNVGHVQGGIGPNTVPDKASALIDIRFLTSEGQRRVERAIGAIVRDIRVPDTLSDVTVIAGRPPMPQSEANRGLYREARKQALILGYDLSDELRFGVSDANLVAGQGIPVLDGLGPVGDLDHSDREYIRKRSILERSALTAAILLGLWESGAIN